jgi:alkylhydroperoxidase family enzyme
LVAVGQVPRTTKELGALAAVSMGRVPPLRAVFRDALQNRGLPVEVLDDLVREGATTRLPERTQDVIGFLRRAALQPARVSASDYTRLRRRGLSEAELAELVAAAGAIGLLIATARALGEAEG